MKNIHQLTVPTPFEVGDVHIYLIVDEAVSLIDAGVNTEEAKHSLLHQLRKLGYHPEDIDQVILTHHHPDHVGLIESFPTAKIIAHPNVDYWLKEDEAFLAHYEQYYRALLVKAGVDQRIAEQINNLKLLMQFAGTGKLHGSLQEGDTLPGHEDWKVIETKGHAQTHLSFYREKDGLFIGGDHLLLHTSPNPIVEAPYNGESERPKPLLQYRKNLMKCRDLAISTVLPGHGEVFSNVKDYVDERLHSQERRAKKVYELLQKEHLTPFELSKKLFPKHYIKQLELTMSETIGQLDYLMEEDKVSFKMQDGIMYFLAK